MRTDVISESDRCHLGETKRHMTAVEIHRERWWKIKEKINAQHFQIFPLVPHGISRLTSQRLTGNLGHCGHPESLDQLNDDRKCRQKKEDGEWCLTTPGSAKVDYLKLRKENVQERRDNMPHNFALSVNGKGYKSIAQVQGKGMWVNL